jgi:AAA domain/IclR helix-turn-helix domain
LPPREMILSPWLPEKGLAMIFAERGIGKTWIGLNTAYCIAGGGSFLRWHAIRPRRVLYIDGEMPARVIKDRLGLIIAAAPYDADGDNIKFIAADFQTNGLPDLANEDGQKFYDKHVAWADVVIVDNISTVCRGLKENDADSFTSVLEWMLRLRKAGKSVVLVHHSGKGGAQRGSSRKEDILDTVIGLRRPPDFDASQGARFEVRFTKNRGFTGPDAEPFEAALQKDGTWVVQEIISDFDDDGIGAMHRNGMSIREIAERTGIPKSTVSDKLKAAVQCSLKALIQAPDSKVSGLSGGVRRTKQGFLGKLLNQIKDLLIRTLRAPRTTQARLSDNTNLAFGQVGHPDTRTPGQSGQLGQQELSQARGGFSRRI